MVLKNKKIEFSQGNIIWAFFGKVASGVKLVVLGIIVARHLGPSEFGSLNYTISFVSLLSVLAEFRLQSILSRELSKENADINRLLGTSFVISFIFATIGYIILSIVSYNMNQHSSIHLFVLIYGLSYFFQTLRIVRAFYIANFKNIHVVKVEVIATILIVLFAFLFVQLNVSLFYFIILRAIDVLVVSLLLLLLYVLNYGSLIKWRYDNVLRKKLVKDSFPLVLSGFAIMIFQKIDQVMLGQMIGVESVGQYSAAVTIVGFISFVPVIIAESYAPTLVKMLKKDEYHYNRQNFSDYMIWGSIFISIILFYLSPFLINTLFGSDYTPAIEVLRVFSIKGVLVSLGAVAAQIMIVENTHQLAYLKGFLGGFANVLLNYIFIIQYGLIGAAWASIIAFFLSSYFSHLLIKRYRYIFVIQTKSICLGLYNIYYNIQNIYYENKEK